mmetsp:Transcript_4652/g.14035  ORF Transcript_4652/g.14035 Transcript_4652/m.14035 type:complete len:208 (+) Transcript_4652:478-1101(+)
MGLAGRLYPAGWTTGALGPGVVARLCLQCRGVLERGSGLWILHRQVPVVAAKGGVVRPAGVLGSLGGGNVLSRRLVLGGLPCCHGWGPAVGGRVHRRRRLRGFQVAHAAVTSRPRRRARSHALLGTPAERPRGCGLGCRRPLGLRADRLVQQFGERARRSGHDGTGLADRVDGGFGIGYALRRPLRRELDRVARAVLPVRHVQTGGT